MTIPPERLLPPSDAGCGWHAYRRAADAILAQLGLVE